MSNSVNYKLALMLSISGLINMTSICAMEKEEQALVRAVSASASQNPLLSRETMLEKYHYYSALIEEGKHAKPAQCKNCFSAALSFLGEFFELYKENYRDRDLMDENRFLAFKIIFLISQVLYSGLEDAAPGLLHDENEEFSNYAYPFFSKIVETDLFITDEFSIIPGELLVEVGFNKNISYKNFLTHLMNFLENYPNRFQYGGQIKQFHRYSAQWVEESKSAFPLSVDTKKQIDTLIERIEKNSRIRPNTRERRKISAMRYEKTLSEFDEFIKIAQQENVARGAFDPALYYHEFNNLKNIAALDWEKNKNTIRLLKGHREAYQVLLQLEQGLANKLNLSNDAQGWNEEDYRAIYTELAGVLSLDVLKSCLPEILTISINCVDLRATEFRVNLFAKMLGGSADHLEAVPHVIRPLFATFKYLQGEPEFWDTLIQKAEQQKQKKREANQRKKEAQQRKRSQAIVAEIERKKEVERESLLSKEKEAQAKAEVLEQKERQKSDPRSSLEVVEPVFAKEESTAEIKQKAQQALARKKEKQEKKDEKNHTAIEQEIHQTSEAPPPATPSESSTSLPKITTTTRKRYQNLYSLTPSLSTKNAIALLGGFGLKTSSAKGSHTKLTLHSGETITDVSGKVIWRCPDLEELMTIVPRWDGKDIPDYMVKNLRYILKKIGVKSGSF